MPATRPTITLVVAMTENRVIGTEGGMPWHLPADLARFKRLTVGHPILMGRRTYESIGRPLPERRNIILTRRDDFAPPGVEIVHRFADALAMLEAGEELFVIGGEQVYRLALPQADRVHLTLIHAHLSGDVMFPELDAGQWRLVEEEPRPADERNAYAMTFRRYERCGGAAV